VLLLLKLLPFGFNYRANKVKLGATYWFQIFPQMIYILFGLSNIIQIID